MSEIVSVTDIQSPDQFRIIRYTHELNIFTFFFKLNGEFMKITELYTSLFNRINTERDNDSLTTNIDGIDDKYKQFVQVAVEYMFIATVDTELLKTD